MNETLFADIEQRAPAFAKAVGRDHLQRIVSAGRQVTISTGASLIEDGMAVDALYLILDGSVAVSIAHAGQRLLVGRLGPGQFVGEVALLSDDSIASATVVAETEVRLLCVRRADFERLLDAYPPLASAWLRQLTGMLAERLRASAAAVTSSGGGMALSGADRLKTTDAERHRGLLHALRELLGLEAARD